MTLRVFPPTRGHGVLIGILLIVLLWFVMAVLGGGVILFVTTMIPGITVSGLGGVAAFIWFLIATFAIIPVLSVQILTRFSREP